MTVTLRAENVVLCKQRQMHVFSKSARVPNFISLSLHAGVDMDSARGPIVGSCSSPGCINSHPGLKGTSSLGNLACEIAANNQHLAEPIQ